MGVIVEFISTLIGAFLESKKARLWAKLILVFLLLALILCIIWLPVIGVSDIDWTRPVILTILMLGLLIALAVILIRQEKNRVK